MTVSVITGCSTGIGYATALRLAADGHHVVATMRTPDASDLGVVSKERGLDVEVRALDVTDGPAVDALFSDVIATHGGVDVLVNNAGISGRAGIVEEAEMDAYQEVFDTNFFGAMRCTKAVLPSMRERGGGSIVQVTSQAGRFCAPGMSGYNSSKWALEAASETLAVEVAPFGIRVAIIEPGLILTAIWGKVDMQMPAGPYAPTQIRLGTVILEEMPYGSPSEEVADCIAEAITTDTPKLRWLVGRGAELNVASRNAMTDEEWVEAWHLPDDEFRAKMPRGSS
jgi:NAD(P)-dependent dehydrogenase (short-subunit alcohol dehydrogenase family)